jgi:hypothetical protein
MTRSGHRRTSGSWTVLCVALLAGVVSGCDGEAAHETGEASVSSQNPDAGPGRWKEFRSHRFDPGLSDEQRERIEKLEAIGYASGSVEAPRRPVVPLHVPGRSDEGLNFYNSGHGPEAFLVDMQGTELRRWRYPFRDAFPDHPLGDEEPAAAYWRRAELLSDGSLLAIFEGLGLIALDRDSKLRWARPIAAHHDLQHGPDGQIFVLTREAHLVPRVHATEPILEDFVSVLDREGRELHRVSILEAFERSPYREIFEQREQRSGDIFHTNSLRLLDGSESEHPTFRSGNVLISSRRLDTVAVIDLEAGSVVWALQGGFRRQHDARLLEGGSLMLFDNSGLGQASRVLELDPESGETLWEYRGDDVAPFYSKWCGTAQRLPNGNTLITESDNGRSFEVTAAGEIVWEFHNPSRAGEDGRFIATLFELERLPLDFLLDTDETGHGSDRDR